MATKTKAVFVDNGQENHGTLGVWRAFQADQRNPALTFPRDPVGLFNGEQPEAEIEPMGAMLLTTAERNVLSSWVVGTESEVEAWLEEPSDSMPDRSRRERFAIKSKPKPLQVPTEPQRVKS
jgi:hypothetical protein